MSNDANTAGAAATRVALVTGATRGIGQAIADALAGTGLTVVGTATTDGGEIGRAHV